VEIVVGFRYARSLPKPGIRFSFSLSVLSRHLFLTVVVVYRKDVFVQWDARYTEYYRDEHEPFRRQPRRAIISRATYTSITHVFRVSVASTFYNGCLIGQNYLVLKVRSPRRSQSTLTGQVIDGQNIQL